MMDEKEKELLRGGFVAYCNIEVCPGAFDIWLLLWVHSTKQIVEISIDKLRVESGFSSVKVSRCIKKLKQEGLLNQLTVPGKVGRYLLKDLK